MALRPLSYPEVQPRGNGSIAFTSMHSTRMGIIGDHGYEDYYDTTYFDFNTSAYSPRIYVFYCPYGGITPWPSEPINYEPGHTANYAHRIFSIYDATGDDVGTGFRMPRHWKAGWHVWAEYWDPLVSYVPNRYWEFNFKSDVVPFEFIDFAMCYISPMNQNPGGVAYLSTPSVGTSDHGIVQPPVQGTNGRLNTSPGGAWNEAGVTSATRGVENDTTMAREWFFVANFLFDESGANPSPNYNPQAGIHNVVSTDSPPFTHAGTVKPRYNYQSQKEPNSTLRGQPMPHGVVLSAWVREIKTIGQATYRERVVQPIQSTYNSSTLSLIVKGGNFGPAHVQAF